MNKLLEALKEDIKSDRQSIRLDLYVADTNAVKLRADIEDLLKQQRELCANSATAITEPDFLVGESSLVDEQSILNANILNHE